MSGKALDPKLAEILASIRATVGGEAPPTVTAEAPEVEVAAAPMVAPARPAGDGQTLEAFMAALAGPKIQAWLDAHLPEMVQAAVDAEVRKLMGKS
ncbi:DUF2497 domain-containing protein [Sandaracinobacteroides saxicola]|uniref:DUF2497 domain-containing protein n=1 Tax=Sandaracinobacteroides saxicola TaxID=2759707 RepID=A0A7G5IJW9_9SPHN|nr:DUF2497 domain-containing protein [Sandaracinobacteroides saxicola]QMW23661.1 DUF2497 domain-containing protein [Sandaracinobacteroides saxicola]